MFTLLRASLMFLLSGRLLMMIIACYVNYRGSIPSDDRWWSSSPPLLLSDLHVSTYFYLTSINLDASDWL